MAFPIVQSVDEGSTNSAGTNHTITKPSGTVANDLLIICLDKGSTAATVNAHADWTELLDENLANGLYIAYHYCDGNEPASWTLVTSASTRDAHITYRISGAENPATQTPEIGTTSSGSSATPDPPSSATPGSTKDFLFIAFYGAAGEEADDDTWSDTPPTNYTPSPPRMKSCGTAGTNLGGLIAAAERSLNTGSAENPGTFAKDTSAAWRAQTIMVHPASSVTNFQTLSAAQLASASLASVSTFARSLPATILAQSTLTTISTFLRTLSATQPISVTLNMVKTVVQTLSSVATALGTLGVVKLQIVTMNATIIILGFLTKIVAFMQTLSATQFTSATLSTIKTFIQTLSTTISALATLNAVLVRTIRFILRKSDNSLVDNETVKYSIHEYGGGDPSDSNFMTRSDKGTTTTDSSGEVNVRYTGPTAVGENVYVSILRPDSQPTESVIWKDMVQQ